MTTADDELQGLSALLFGMGRRLRPLEFVGRGATGAVYKVLDEELHEVVALKRLHALEPDEIYRLKREFRSLADVRHDNVVQLYDLSIDARACFFTMELVDGMSFVDHVRAGQPAVADRRLARFLSAAIQLLAGLEAVHAAGRLHRDVKPSNVLVAGTGRVVLLDFDLAVPIEHRPGGVATWRSAAGTFEYMAPEQAIAGTAGVASDLYSVGAMFYEALSGRRPFVGTPAAIIAAKAAGAPPPPSRHRPDVPEWLDRLTVRLLTPDPAARPTLLEALDRLRAELPSHGVSPAVAPSSLFVGRELELGTLRRVAEAPATRPRLVRVAGESGIGKTHLVQHFLSEAEAAGTTLVLRGRCLPQEAVAYKGLDMVVDALCRFLGRLDDDERRATLAGCVGDLTRLFPVLGRVRGLLPSAGDTPTDASELRRRGVEELCAILARIAARRRLVLWIDDAQWADDDSVALLATMLRSPAPPACTLVLSHRDGDVAGTLLAPLEEAARDAPGVTIDVVPLGPLDPESVRQVAARVCPPALRAAAYVEAIAEQSGGSPFLLREIGRHLAGEDVAAPHRSSTVALDVVIRGRLDRLPAAGRRAVELVAVAGGPIDRRLVLDLARHGEGGRQMLAGLERERLVRFTVAGDRVGIEAHHDRIREAVLEALAPETRREHHRELALRLEAIGTTPPELLARHFHGAGLASRAADYAVAAADAASASLAFVRAAELYRLARTWDARDAAWTRLLLAREGDALANAGHFGGSAAAFTAAAADASGGEALELRRRACEQLLAAGRLDEGLGALNALLRELGLPQPGRPTRTMLEIAGRAVGFALRSSQRPAVAVIAPEDRLRIDTCYAAAKVLVDADPMRGVYFSVQALRLALRGGDAERIARGLVLVGGAVSASGDAVFSRVGGRLMRRGRVLAGDGCSEHLRGTIAVAEGQVLMLQGRWREALERSEEGLRRLERCRDSAGERMVGHFAILRALEDLGAHRRLVERASAVLQAATAAGNRYAAVYALHQLVLSRLAAGDLASARSSASRSGAEWTTTGVHIQHLYRLRAEAHCDLWEGRPRVALARLDAELATLRASRLLRIALVRVDVWFLRARIFLAAAATPPAAPERYAASASAAMVRRALGDARRLARAGRADATAHAALVRAGAALLRGDRGGALARLAEAEAAYGTAGMAAYAACATYRRGELVGGVDGAAARRRAEAQFAECGVDAVAPWVALCAPGFVPSAEREPGLEREIRLGAQPAIAVVHDLEQHRAIDAGRPQ